jgi:hypothetical protein
VGDGPYGDCLRWQDTPQYLCKLAAVIFRAPLGIKLHHHNVYWSHCTLHTASGARASWHATPILTWLVLRHPDKREEGDAQVLAAFQTPCLALAEATQLARDFAQLGRDRQPDTLEPWIERAVSSLADALQRFAT